MPEDCLLYYITDRTQFAGDEATRRRLLLRKIGEAARCGVDFIQLRERDLSTCALEELAREALGAAREGSSARRLERQFSTRLLINSRSDVAIAVGADGVHLRADEISVEDARAMWTEVSGRGGEPDRCKLSAAEAAPFQGLPSRRAGARPPGRGRPGLRGQRFSEAGNLEVPRGTAENRALPKTIPAEWIVSASCHSEGEVRAAAVEKADFAVFAPVFEKKDSPGAAPLGLEALHRACRCGIPVLALGGVTLENASSCLEAGAAGIAGIRLFQENDVRAAVQRVRAPRS